MSLSKVKIWYMTEEERLAYIAKNPIVPVQKPKGSTFAEVDKQQYQKVIERHQKEPIKRPSVFDHIDKDELHRMYLSGETVPKIAKLLNVSRSNLNNYIMKQRKLNPEKWPYRR